MHNRPYSLVLTLASFIVLSLALPAYTLEVPKNGHDWRVMPESEQVIYCEILIYGIWKDYGMVGVGNPSYQWKNVNFAANYFAGRINHYYKNYSLSNPMENAAEWAWPETEKLLIGRND